MNIREAFKYRSSGLAIIALTSVCNCKCPMCDLWKYQYRVDAKRLIDNLDVLWSNNFKLLQFTGGEPTTLRELPEIVSAASDRGFRTMMMTNGTTMKDSLAKRLKDVGLNSVGISVDHYDDEIASTHRAFPHINERVKQAVEILKRNGISVYCTTLLTKSNGKDIARVIEFVNRELDIPFTFCNPETSVNYFLKANSGAGLTNQELVTTIKEIGAAKQRGATILNTKAHVRNTLARLEQGKSIYACGAGQKVIYVDWNLDIFPCFTRPKMCKLEELGPTIMHAQDCDQCIVQCIREPSISRTPQGMLDIIADLSPVLKYF